MTPQGILGMAVSLLDSLGLLPLLVAFLVGLITIALLNRLLGRD